MVSNTTSPSGHKPVKGTAFLTLLVYITQKFNFCTDTYPMGFHSNQSRLELLGGFFSSFLRHPNSPDLSVCILFKVQWTGIGFSVALGSFECN